MKKICQQILIIAFLTFLLTGPPQALANQASVSLEAPDTVASGSEVTVLIHVFHNGNNILHYTNRVQVKADGKELAIWEYNWLDRPESGNFTREVKYTVNEDVEITAEANCNVHGSQGPGTLRIKKKSITE